MFTFLKNSFMQTSLGTIIWIMMITSMSNSEVEVSYLYFWRIIIIGLLFGLVFGVGYPYLWNYSIMNAYIKVAVSSLLNMGCVALAVHLYSAFLFSLMKPYILFMLVFTLIIHYLIFYVYMSFKNRNLVNELNDIN